MDVYSLKRDGGSAIGSLHQGSQVRRVHEALQAQVRGQVHIISRCMQVNAVGQMNAEQGEKVTGEQQLLQPQRSAAHTRKSLASMSGACTHLHIRLLIDIAAYAAPPVHGVI